MKNTGTYSFPERLFAPWVKTVVCVDEDEVTISRTETSLEIVPDGTDETILPMEDIDMAFIVPYREIKQMFKGLGCVLAAFVIRFLLGGLIAEIAVAALTIVGMYFLMSCFWYRMCIQTYKYNYYVMVPFTCRGEAKQCKELIQRAVRYDNSVVDDLKNSTEKEQNYFLCAIRPFVWMLVAYSLLSKGADLLTDRLGAEVTKMETASTQGSEAETEESHETRRDLADWELYYYPILEEYQAAMNRKISKNEVKYVNANYMQKLSWGSIFSETPSVYASLPQPEGMSGPMLILSVIETNDQGVEEHKIIDVYTFNNGEGHHPIEDEQMGTRNTYDLCQNCMIRVLMEDSEHILDERPVEAQYLQLTADGNYEVAEEKTKEDPDFESFINKYPLFGFQKWNDLRQWSSPL